MASQGVIEKDIGVDELERANTAGSSESDRVNDAHIAALTRKEQKHVWYIIDRRLIVAVSILYCSVLIERYNINVAFIEGMVVDLGLTGNRPLILVLVYYIPFMLFQIPGLLLMRRISPLYFIPGLSFLAGIIMLCFSFVRKWTDLLALRILLGFVSTGLLSGIIYLFSCWYPRHNLDKRNTLLFIFGSASTTIGSVQSYLFSLAKNTGWGPTYWGQRYGPTPAHPTTRPGIHSGIAGWRWIFIFQGTLTCLIALGVIPLMVDFPERGTKQNTKKVKYLTEKEVDYVVARIEKDRHDVYPEAFNWATFFRYGLEWKVWTYSILSFLATILTFPNGSLTTPVVKAATGYGTLPSAIISSPPYVLASIVMFIFGWYGDKYHIRSPFIIASGMSFYIGLPILTYLESPGVQYFGAFFSATGATAMIPTIWTWQANNIRGQWKRIFWTAMMVGASGMGSVVGNCAFQSKDGPHYWSGVIVCMVAASVAMVLTVVQTLVMLRDNKRAAAGEIVIEGLEGFRYTL